MEMLDLMVDELHNKKFDTTVKENENGDKELFITFEAYGGEKYFVPVKANDYKEFMKSLDKRTNDTFDIWTVEKWLNIQPDQMHGDNDVGELMSNARDIQYTFKYIKKAMLEIELNKEYWFEKMEALDNYHDAEKLFADIPDKLMKQDDFAMTAVEKSAYSYAFLRTEHQNNLDIAMNAIQNNCGLPYRDMSDDLKMNYDLSIQALLEDPAMIAEVPADLLKDKGFINEMREEDLLEDKEIIREAKENGIKLPGDNRKITRDNLEV